MRIDRQLCVASRLGRRSGMMKLGAIAMLIAGPLSMQCLSEIVAAEKDMVAPAVTVQGGQGSPEPYMPVYKPRRESAMAGRIDGGFRGGREGEPVLKVLAPFDHIGETLKKSPTLYWYLSQVTSDRITFTFEDPRLLRPILEVGLTRPE